MDVELNQLSSLPQEPEIGGVLADTVAHQVSVASDGEFFDAYEWALYPLLTVEEALRHLQTEISKLHNLTEGWRKQEVATNVYLLACGISNCTEEYLRGPTLKLPGNLAGIFRPLSKLFDFAANNPLAKERITARNIQRRWQAALMEFLLAFVAYKKGQSTDFGTATAALVNLASSPWPAGLVQSAISVPSPFRRLDLSADDVMALGQILAKNQCNKSEKLLLVGLRTSGSYFVPLIKANLICDGYENVSALTIEPGKGPGRWERHAIAEYARKGYQAIIVDDPPHSGNTILNAFNILTKLGFELQLCKALVPNHPSKPNWHSPLPPHYFMTLAPDQWHRSRLLDSGPSRELLGPYFGVLPHRINSIRRCDDQADFRQYLVGNSPDPRMKKLKRVFRLTINHGNGTTELRYVLGKSVGCGWLGYHSFLIAQRLAGHVPPIIALRDGVLYTEYFPQNEIPTSPPPDRAEILDMVADYVAARVNKLRLKTYKSLETDQHRHNSGMRLIEKTLSRNYGRFPHDLLWRSRIGRRLRPHFEEMPTLIDGAMQPNEWIFHDNRLFKTDFEHHGFGKGPANFVDPAFDLCDAILNFGLSDEEQSRLLKRYSEISADREVNNRILLNKLAAGLWTMNEAQEAMRSKPLSAEWYESQHQRFMAAWDFLTVETAAFCGQLYEQSKPTSWNTPLVALDIDGVIDLRLMGFPATTMAGAEALANLNANNISVILNTARSAREVKEYCRAYNLSGGVAEHGTFMWDAIAGRGQVLINAKAQQQLQILRERLSTIPGVYLDDRHLYSIRAFTYIKASKNPIDMALRSMRVAELGDGAVAPLPDVLISQVMIELDLDLLTAHNTTIDTTVTVRNVDKGTGLIAMRDWVLGPNAETIAVGDQEPDLAMFARATHSYAPSNLTCRLQAKLLGCNIVEQPHQRGLLSISRQILKALGRHPIAKPQKQANLSASEKLFAAALSAADDRPFQRTLKSIASPSIFDIFVR